MSIVAWEQEEEEEEEQKLQEKPQLGQQEKLKGFDLNKNVYIHTLKKIKCKLNEINQLLVNLVVPQ